MNRQGVITRFCILSAFVMQEKFDCQIPADCFCGSQVENFQFSEKIMEFIEQAVRDSLPDKSNQQ